MNISLTFKNFEPSDHLRRYAERRFRKLERFLRNSEGTDMTVVLTVDKFRHKADVQLFSDDISISAVEQSSDMYATVDLVQDKLETRLKKHNDRIKEKRRETRRNLDSSQEPRNTTDDAAAPVAVIVTEHVEPKPMFADEAALQLSRRDDMVLIFLNAETDRINVLYRRKEGDFGLIDPGR
ncbi:MAG: ribosome-associated translation inhibitor RaiA [Desulfovibrio sp.]|jgi:putative sigma-54 modulation protein|nr:ribosome-associated translation inhibitor RaiA [Desulfovibrio sp.]